MESQLSHHQYTLCRITALIDRSPPPLPSIWLHLCFLLFDYTHLFPRFLSYLMHPNHLISSSQHHSFCDFKITASLIRFVLYLAQVPIRHGRCHCAYSSLSISGWFEITEVYPLREKHIFNMKQDFPFLFFKCNKPVLSTGFRKTTGRMTWLDGHVYESIVGHIRVWGSVPVYVIRRNSPLNIQRLFPI